MVRICYQQDAGGVLLEFRRTVSAKQSKTDFMLHKMDPFYKMESVKLI
jgi:hypothetical protein